jgi:hypothetical protein
MEYCDLNWEYSNSKLEINNKKKIKLKEYTIFYISKVIFPKPH